MAYPQYGNLGILGGKSMPGWGQQPPTMGQRPMPVNGGNPPVHPAWGINPPQFKQQAGMQVPPQSGIAQPIGGQNPVWGGQPVHPAWGINPPHFGGGAEGLMNHLASLRQMNSFGAGPSPARSLQMISNRY